MLPLVDKPTIQYVVEEAVASGLVGFDHRHRAQQARDRGSLRRGLRARVLPERSRKTGRAGRDQDHLLARVGLLRAPERSARARPRHPACAAPLVGDEPFGVFLGDDIIASPVPCMRQLLDVYGTTAARCIAVSACRASASISTASPPAGSLGGNVCEITRSRREAEARGRAVGPGHHRPLRTDPPTSSTSWWFSRSRPGCRRDRASARSGR